jgi:AraC family transcriptional regulator, regulatory protein of adaptative response / methylated-DNA-[protein]-cysteine methyltransferase
MQPITEDYNQLARDYELIAKAIVFIENNYQAQPSLKDVAQSVGLSEFHFQRLFTRWAGISPKRFLQYLTKEHAKQILERSTSILATAYQSGLSSPGRLHDLFVVTEAVTPGEYKNRGEGLTIFYGLHPSPFGNCLVALTERGICHLAFIEAGDYPKLLNLLSRQWDRAKLMEDRARTETIVPTIMAFNRGFSTGMLSLHLVGTNFQLKVWEALLRIPPGQMVTYEDLAGVIKTPKAARAVGSAVGRNPIPMLIPCHRVIRKVGEFGNYRYGSVRKKALLGWEMAQQEQLTNLSEYSGIESY